jgi:hypothetical protein
MTEAEWFTSVELTALLAFVAGQNAPPGAVVPPVTMNERKLRLFLVGCCRRQWDLFVDPRCWQAVEVAESLADGLAAESERGAAEQSALTIRKQVMEEMLAPSGAGKTHPGMTTMLTADAACVTCWAYPDLIRQQIAYGRSPTYIPLHPRDRRIRASYGPYKVAEAVAESLAQSLGVAGTQGQVYSDAEKTEQSAQADLLRCIVGNPFRPVSINLGWLTPTVTALAQTIYEERAFDRLPILADALEDAGCTDPTILEHCRGPGPHVRGSAGCST